MTEEPRELDDLFRLRPEEFVSARNALAKRLKSAGDQEGAAAVQALRKPTVTAWALNVVARDQPEVVDGVIAAGEDLRAAMEKAIGGDRSDFQSAQKNERNSIRLAVDAASSVIESAGGRATEASRQRMTDTLRAAAVDSEIAGLLRRGVLETDVSAPGFGLEGLSAPISTSQEPERAEEDARRRERQARLDELERGLKEAEGRFRTAVSAAEEAEERALRLRREADEAKGQLEAAKKQLKDEGES